MNRFQNRFDTRADLSVQKGKKRCGKAASGSAPGNGGDISAAHLPQDVCVMGHPGFHKIKLPVVGAFLAGVYPGGAVFAEQRISDVGRNREHAVLQAAVKPPEVDSGNF